MLACHDKTTGVPIICTFDATTVSVAPGSGPVLIEVGGTVVEFINFNFNNCDASDFQSITETAKTDAPSIATATPGPTLVTRVVPAVGTPYAFAQVTVAGVAVGTTKVTVSFKYALGSSPHDAQFDVQVVPAQATLNLVIQGLPAALLGNVVITRGLAPVVATVGSTIQLKLDGGSYIRRRT